MEEKLCSKEIIDKDILELLGVGEIDPTKKDELYKKMVETIQTRILARVDDLLYDADAAQIKFYLETNSQEKFDLLMQERNIDIEKLYIEEALLYKLELTELINSREG